jgi:hypothetical protein
VLGAVPEAALEVERQFWKVRLELEGFEVIHNIRQ